MADVGVIISGDRRVQQLFDTFPEILRPQLLAVIAEETEALASAIRAAVPRRTGSLASEIATAIQDRDTRITGIVFISGEFAKAGALEYGAHRTISVAAHAARLSHAWGRPIAPETVTVAQHSRQENLEATRFLRGPFSELEAQITARLQDVVNQVTEAADAG